MHMRMARPRLQVLLWRAQSMSSVGGGTKQPVKRMKVISLHPLRRHGPAGPHVLLSSIHFAYVHWNLIVDQLHESY